MTPRIGLVLPLSSPADAVLAFARRAEELGFDGVFAFDHFFLPGGPRDRPALEAYATLAAVAASTSRIAVGTLVTRASLRPAGLLAKQAVALDDVAAGRFVLGIGTGDADSAAEDEAFGLVELDRRARREHLVETLRAVRALFVGEAWPGGEHVPPIAGPLLPPPRTPGGPPVWAGGASEAVVRIAAAEADGWNAWGIDVATFRERVGLLRRASSGRRVEATWGGVAVLGRDAAEVERLVEARAGRGPRHAFAGDLASARGWLGELAGAGATWAVLLAAGGRDRIEVIGRELLPALAGSG